MDAILYWNAVALEANRRDFSNLPGTSTQKPEQGGPTLSSRAMAIVHLAMYDAHAATSSAGLPRYLMTPTAPMPGTNTNAEAAVAGAAHACLSALYPRQIPFFDERLSSAGIRGSDADLALQFGAQVAKYMLMKRQNDVGASDDDYVPSQARLRHRPDPSNPGQGFHGPFYGKNANNLFAAATAHDLDDPYGPGTREYKKALKYVRAKGITPALTGTLPPSSKPRTPEETLIGIFWAYDGAREIGTPPRLYNQIVRKVAMTAINPRTGVLNTVDDNARLFALVNAAMGDAGILAWAEKYKHDLWRPVLGIREHDLSMGVAGYASGPSFEPQCDPDWLPLGAPASNSYVAETGRADKNATPGFPAYPSGHATFGAAALHVTRLFYGIPSEDQNPDSLLQGEFVSDEMNGINRDNAGNVRSRHARAFDGGLWEMIEENGFSRVYLGVHWSFDAFPLLDDGKPDYRNKRIGGVGLGLRIAEDIFAGGKFG